jgi:hypothetical protein
MSRAVRLLTVVALAAVIVPSTLAAQAARPVVRAPRPETPPRIVPATFRAAPLRPLVTMQSAANQAAVKTSLSVIGGAALGSFLGYFMSQVVKSDWEGERTADRAEHRRRFAISGAAVGAIGGYLIRPRGRRANPEPPAFYVYVAPTARHYITNVELRRAIATNALEAVQLLRPEWLGPTQLAAESTANGSPTASTDTSVAVYVVETRVGGPEALAEVSIPEIQELRLYEPREAARRWGSAHTQRAIEIVPAATPAIK